jgi:hypothetical protein
VCVVCVCVCVEDLHCVVRVVVGVVRVVAGVGRPALPRTEGAI